MPVSPPLQTLTKVVHRYLTDKQNVLEKISSYLATLFLKHRRNDYKWPQS